MNTIIQLLVDWGYIGLFIATYLAGSFIPFSSEAVLVGLILPVVGLDPVKCVAVASAGNILGGTTDYYIGSRCDKEWMMKYFHIKPQKIRKTIAYLHNKSAIFGFFAFVPFAGQAILLGLGYLRANAFLTILSMSIGKTLRYIVVAYITLQIVH